MARKPPPEDDSPSFRRASAAVVGKHADKRRTTVYFDLTVARDLADYCRSHDVNMSVVVSDAVADYLRRKGK